MTGASPWAIATRDELVKELGQAREIPIAGGGIALYYARENNEVRVWIDNDEERDQQPLLVVSRSNGTVVSCTLNEAIAVAKTDLR